MTVKEFYDAAGGGYEVMSAKFPSDATIKAFLGIFKRDKNYESLKQLLNEGDVQSAFSAAHTLKGVVLNLNLEGLAKPVCDIVEALRAGNMSAARALFPAVEEAYERAYAALNEFFA